MSTPAASAKSEFLRRAEETPDARRSADVRDLLEALEWCDLSSSDPQAEPGALSVAHGGDHLTRCGGDGTPDVAQLCATEHAIDITLTPVINLRTFTSVNAYEPSGPPGQTSDLNDAPLSRRHHHAKTHHPYVLHQTGPGQYEWTTPHGLRRVVDRAGTHVPGH